MKIAIQRQSDKKRSPYRLKSGRYTVSVHSADEAKRIIDFIIKIIGGQDDED